MQSDSTRDDSHDAARPPDWQLRLSGTEPDRIAGQYAQATGDEAPTVAHRPADVDPGKLHADEDSAAANPLGQLSTFAGYSLERVLGRGGMGVVYLARQTALDRLVALKVLLASSHAGPAELARFRNEAQTVAQLQHPNIVQVFEVGESGGVPFCVLEYVAGGSLAQALDNQPQPPRATARLVEQLARAVQAAHDHDIVHRDLKPANVLLATAAAQQPPPTADAAPSPPGWRTAIPKISDFGLAKRLLDDSGQTKTGDIVGTPSYMSPEQAEGRVREVGPAADIYGLGTILYEMLTGRPPFLGLTTADTLIQVITEEPVPPRRLIASIPLDLDTICLQCLRKEPLRRYRTASELADDLHRFQRDEPIRARPVGPLERGWRWCRRNPLLAGLQAAVAVGAIIAVVCAVVAIAFAVKADRNAGLADEKTREAQSYARRAIERAYLGDMLLARISWDKNLPDRVQEVLDGQRPERTGGIDLRRFEWNYWYRLTHAEERLVTLQDGIVDAVLSADGKQLVALVHDETIRVLDAETGKLLHTWPCPARGVRSLALDPSGTRLALGGVDGKVRVWDPHSGKELAVGEGHVEAVLSVAFAPNGKQLASCGYDGTARVWDTATGKQLIIFREHTGRVNGVAYHPDGSCIASGGWDKLVRIWDSATGQSLRTCELPSIGSSVAINMANVRYSPDGKLVAANAWNSTTVIWDASTGHEMRRISSDARPVAGAVFDRESRRLFEAGSGFGVRVFDVPTGRLLRLIRAHSGNVAVGLFPDGRRVVTAGMDQTVRWWDLERPPACRILRGHNSQVSCVAVSPDGRWIASSGGDWDGAGCYVRGELKVWDAASDVVTHDLQGHSSGVTSVAFCPTTGRLASASGVWDALAKKYAHGEIKLWDPVSGVEVACLRGHASGVLCVAFSPDGRWLASGSFDKTIILWDLTTGRPIRTLEGHKSLVSSLAFDSRGDRLASGDHDQQVKVWDVHTGAPLHALSVNGFVSSVRFSPNDQRLAVSTYDAVAKLWDLATGKVVLSLKGTDTYGTGVAFSPDGKRILTTGEDGTMHLWDTETGQDLVALLGHTDVIRSAVFTPDGQRIVSGGWDKTVRIWDGSPIAPASGGASKP